MAERLVARITEIEEVVLRRVESIDETDKALDPEYVQGLHEAISVAIGLGLEGIVSREAGALPIPVKLLAQARLAARNSIPLDTVLRRYFAGYFELDRFLSEEAHSGGLLMGEALSELRRAHADLFEQLTEAVAEEYNREARGGPPSPERRRRQTVRKLLAGEFADTSSLAYEFDAVHLAAIARGGGGGPILKELAEQLKSRLLSVPQGDETIWAWFGSKQPPDHDHLRRVVDSTQLGKVVMALGEIEVGLNGWRRTHRQAREAFTLALRRPQVVARYSTDPLLAFIIQDDFASQSLQNLFLTPLDNRNDGLQLKQTLRAYFAAGRNGASAAAALGVSRQTIRNRLAAIEDRLGRPLMECGAALEVALQLDELEKHD